VSTLKLIFISILIGILTTAALTWAAFSIEDERVSRVLLWQLKPVMYLAGTGPLLGYDAQGNPMYEGTPVHLIFGFLGLLLGVPIYSVLSFAVLWVLRRARSKAPA
jgi:hypothetical protein